MSSDDLERLARDLFEAYGGGDLETMRSLLAEDLSAYITNAAAGVDRVEGATTSRVMTMIEIKAERQGRMLHNFAAFLARASEGQVVELWMVDAKPAYSDEFWS